eukprot:TRINITY_DN2694_c0_g1_i3.p1 TRINITY_DN2694_c0_g1~~TRINITY_DN2694_c0_g1_i3.p1  ORF type:complete len:511 (-),score=82.97 TRINITY_DN2694_c0_g1_i3:12-1544(-)
MHGPSSDAAFWGGQGGALRYHLGTVVVVRICGSAPPPPEWRRKSRLQEAFGDFGHILRLETPEGQGLAYVEFDDKLDAEDMVREMHMKKVCGRQVTVEIAKTSLQSKKINIHDRITDVAQRYRLDESATAQLLRVFAERARLVTCDLDRDLEELSDHLASSNKPSALVCKMLVDIRCGKPLGPCKFSKGGDNKPPHPGGGPSSGAVVGRALFHDDKAVDRDRERDRGVRDRDRSDRDRERDRSDRDRGEKERNGDRGRRSGRSTERRSDTHSGSRGRGGGRDRDGVKNKDKDKEKDNERGRERDRDKDRDRAAAGRSGSSSARGRRSSANGTGHQGQASKDASRPRSKSRRRPRTAGCSRSFSGSRCRSRTRSRSAAKDTSRPRSKSKRRPRTVGCSRSFSGSRCRSRRRSRPTAKERCHETSRSHTRSTSRTRGEAAGVVSVATAICSEEEGSRSHNPDPESVGGGRLAARRRAAAARALGGSGWTDSAAAAAAATKKNMAVFGRRPAM